MMLLSTSAMQLPLHDIVDDYQVSWWPLAFGWWLLIASSLIVLILATLYLIKHHRMRRGYAHIERMLQIDADSLSDISLRLKQILLLKFNREHIAPHDAEQFSQVLLAQLPANERDRFSEDLSTYLRHQYQPQDAALVSAYQQWSITWWRYARTAFKREARYV